MRLATLVLVLTLTACSGGREAASGPGYVLTENADGSTTIAVDPNDEGAMMAALIAAADRVHPAWEPPERTDDLERIGTTDLGASGTAYRYRFAPGRLDVYVYRSDQDVAWQVAETEAALGQLVERGRIDAFERVGQTERTVPWRDGEAVLHRIEFEETMEGEAWESYMYLLRDLTRWVKVRASFPEKTLDEDALDAIVLDLLAG